MKVQDWKTLLRGSFAGMTAPFAVHPNDDARARKMFHAAMNSGIEMEAILAEAKSYLLSQGCTQEYIEKELIRINNYKANPMKKLKSKRAWLVTWEGIEVSSEVVALFNYRKSASTVKEFVEQFYIAKNYSLVEKLTYARHGKDNPYPAQYERINGVPWEGRITCGHNPFLLARPVINVAVSFDEDGNEHISWEEINKPNIKV